MKYTVHVLKCTVHVDTVRVPLDGIQNRQVTPSPNNL